MINVIHVWKYYDKILANEDITMEVKKGELVALLGPNGAGKTTLVKQIYGELTPTKGEILVSGSKINNNIKKRMGVIPQECTPYATLSVKDNIYYMGKIKGMHSEKARERTEELLKKLELKEYENRLAEYLSGGLKRRVLLAMALVNDPDVVILDEPTTGLDPEARREVWEVLSELKKEGKAMLLTTHYLDEAERLADRIYFINRKIIMEGTPSEIKSKFSSYYEVIDYSTGKTYYVKEEEVADFIRGIKGKFEVRLPTLEEIYLKVINHD
ncbi:MarR family transcriptional regulator [Acidianus sp. HS-5]|nr:ABC transporter ATP-binding protein [Acidianus sp. HS-5]BDC17903.1 MarR family transcriptional regulator [Acidianus sp. HS-5]